MKGFELLSLLLAVVVSFGVVNGFRVERPNIDEQPNLVNLTGCSGQTITYNGNPIASNSFTVNNSNDGEYRCVNTGESKTVIRKSSILLLLLLLYYFSFSAIPGPTVNITRAADWGQLVTLDCGHRPGNYRDRYSVAWLIRSSNNTEARRCRPNNNDDICSNFNIDAINFNISFRYYPTRNHFSCQVTNTADPTRPNNSPILTTHTLYPSTNTSGMFHYYMSVINYNTYIYTL